MEPIKLELPEVANEALKPLANSIGNTLSSLWDICFGWIDISADKVHYKRTLELQAFKDSLENDISEIPEENLQEPQLSIIGPALEASKYFFEEEELRSMFSKLIANTMNRETSAYTQTSFVEAIKQMSPLDAKIIKYFSSNPKYPVVQYRKSSGDSTFIIRHPIVFLHDFCTEENVKAVEVSLINLKRLGLIEISFNEHIPNDSAYKIYEESSLHVECCKPYGLQFSPFKLDMRKGVIRITGYGEFFITSCL